MEFIGSLNGEDGREFYTVWENEVEERKKVRMTPRAEFQYDNYMKQSDYLYLRHMLGYEEPELDKNSCYVHCIPRYCYISSSFSGSFIIPLRG